MRKRIIPALLAALTGAALGMSPATPAQAATSVYTTPGGHLVNGRYWKTECSKYSTAVVRCKTLIWATKVVRAGGQYHKHNGWVFNNLSYLPSSRAQWKNNNLARSTQWTDASGRKWKTECDTAATGRGACRSYTMSTVAENVGGRFVTRQRFVFNNLVLFSSSTVRAVTSVPAAAPARWMPTEKAFLPPAAATGPASTCKASYYWEPQPTASGERFNPNALTTAHKTFPMGTKLKVTNVSNGRSVVVRVNDRGPYISGRCLDLSRAAMSQIGGISAGVITASYQKVS